MRSLAEEVWHTLSDYTPLCFFLTLPVYDLLLLRSLALWSKRSQKWGGYLVLTPETPTGFYTEVVGSCSLTKIHLEKPVKLPMKYMAEAMPDFAYHYPFSHFASFDKWDKGAISYISMPKGFRRVMEEYGLRPVRKNAQY